MDRTEGPAPRRSFGRLTGLGFELGSTIELAEKRAQLAFLTREKFGTLQPVG